MPTRQTALGRGTDRGRSLLRDLSREVQAARAERGTSYADIGRAMGMSRAQVSRICSGRSPDVSIVRMAQLLAVLGLDLSARAFPNGDGLRDAGQVALLRRLRLRVPARLRWRTEVPVIPVFVPGRADRRAWDAGIDGPGFAIRVEAETHVGDLQAVQRRVALKQRDGAIACVVLLLADTRHHRALVRLAEGSLRSQFPVPARHALRELAGGRSPGGNCLILL